MRCQVICLMCDRSMEWLPGEDYDKPRTYDECDSCIKARHQYERVACDCEVCKA